MEKESTKKNRLMGCDVSEMPIIIAGKLQ